MKLVHYQTLLMFIVVKLFVAILQIWKLSAVDMCELARNSVIQSGWEMSIKKHWLGANWFLPTPMGNGTLISIIVGSEQAIPILDDLSFLR